MKEVDKIIYRGNDTYTKLYKGDTLEYQKKIDYLSFTALESSSVGTVITGTISPKPNIEYSKNKSDWFDLTSTTVSLNAGETIYIRGNNPNSFSLDAANYIRFTMTGNIKASGSIATLVNQTGYNAVIPSSGFLFIGLFRECAALSNVDNLKLMDATGIPNCYQYFFMKTGLVTVPDNLLENCGIAGGMFNSTFRECLSLTKAPKLPKVSVLPKDYYANMFNRCIALSDISNIDLRNTEIGYGSCLQMFYNCTGITKAAYMANNTFTTGSKNNMLSMYNGCTNLNDITGIDFKDTTLTTGCMEQMFSGCKLLTAAPTLPAKTLSERCYWHMFTGCNNLNYIKCLATDISANSCTNNWLYNAASTGTFVKSANMTGWTTGASGIPTGWTVENE